MHDQVGNIAVDEQLPGQQPDDLVGGHATVRTADPEILRSLLHREILKELRVPCAEIVSPGLVVG